MTHPRFTHRSAKHSLILVASLVWGFWLIGMFSGARWHLFAEAWFMSVTMLSLIHI